MFIDFLYRFVIDHITCYYFCIMTYTIGRKYHCEPRVKKVNRNPWFDKMGDRFSGIKPFIIMARPFFCVRAGTLAIAFFDYFVPINQELISVNRSIFKNC